MRYFSAQSALIGTKNVGLYMTQGMVGVSLVGARRRRDRDPF